MYLEVVAVLHYNSHDGVIHARVLKACVSSKYSKCISALKRILSNTAMYIFFHVFVYFLLLRCMIKVWRLACGSEVATQYNASRSELNDSLLIYFSSF